MTLRTRLLLLVTALSLLVTAFPAGAMATGRALDPRNCRLAIGTSAPFGIDSCPGVRPGALVEIPHSGDGDVFCTMGYVLTDGKGHNFMTTAGHCGCRPRMFTSNPTIPRSACGIGWTG